MLFGTGLRTRLDLLRTNNQEIRERAVEKQIHNYKRHPVKINIGDNIFYRDLKNLQDPTWLPGHITGARGDTVFEVSKMMVAK